MKFAPLSRYGLLSVCGGDARGFGGGGGGAVPPVDRSGVGAGERLQRIVVLEFGDHLACQSCVDRRADRGKGQCRQRGGGDGAGGSDTRGGAAGFLDGLDADRAVATAVRQHDPDRLLAPVLGQRMQERIDQIGDSSRAATVLAAPP